MKKYIIFASLIIFILPPIIVDKSLHVIVVNKENKNFVFPVAIGSADTQTLEGDFLITGKSKDPEWFIDGKVYPPYKDDPENGLGTRWMALSWRGYGIHGTNDPFSPGKSVSQGCVRLQNRDVEKIFEYINVGDRVKIYSPKLPDNVKESFSLLLNFYDIKSFIEGSR